MYCCIIIWVRFFLYPFISYSNFFNKNHTVFLTVSTNSKTKKHNLAKNFLLLLLQPPPPGIFKGGFRLPFFVSPRDSAIDGWSLWHAAVFWSTIERKFILSQQVQHEKIHLPCTKNIIEVSYNRAQSERGFPYHRGCKETLHGALWKGPRRGQVVDSAEMSRLQ